MDLRSVAVLFLWEGGEREKYAREAWSESGRGVGGGGGGGGREWWPRRWRAGGVFCAPVGLCSAAGV